MIFQGTAGALAIIIGLIELPGSDTIGKLTLSLLCIAFGVLFIGLASIIYNIQKLKSHTQE
jgi:hypothetical protein